MARLLSITETEQQVYTNFFFLFQFSWYIRMCCRLVSPHRGSHWAVHCPVPAADIFRPSLLNYEFNLLYSKVKCYSVVSKNKFVKMLQVNFNIIGFSERISILGEPCAAHDAK